MSSEIDVKPNSLDHAVVWTHRIAGRYSGYLWQMLLCFRRVSEIPRIGVVAVNKNSQIGNLFLVISATIEASKFALGNSLACQKHPRRKQMGMGLVEGSTPKFSGPFCTSPTAEASKFKFGK